MLSKSPIRRQTHCSFGIFMCLYFSHSLLTSRHCYIRNPVYILYITNHHSTTINHPTLHPSSLLTWASACAGGVGVSALSVEEDPGGCRCCVLRGSPVAVALLAAWVGCQKHLHTHLAEECTHTAAQDHGMKTNRCCFNFSNLFYLAAAAAAAVHKSFFGAHAGQKNVVLYTLITGWVQAVVSSQSTCDVGSREETLRQLGSTAHGSAAKWWRRTRHQWGASWEICP